MSDTSAIDASLSDAEIATVHDKLVRLESERAAAVDEAIKLRLALRLCLQIADQSDLAADRRTCARLRELIHNPAAMKKGFGIRLVAVNGEFH